MKEVVLIVIAHPDDEAISMAGTIFKHTERGDSVVVMSMTNGVGSRYCQASFDVENRKQAAKLASKILGFEWGDCYNFNDNAMDSYPLIEIVKVIEKAKQKVGPTIVYTHSGADLNVDHRVVANAVLTAFRPQPNEVCKELRLFEVASATDYGCEAITGRFSPNLYIDITNEWHKKVEALAAYCAEMRQYPHSRSVQAIKNLTRIRGNQVGLEFAEAFEVVRRIER